MSASSKYYLRKGQEERLVYLQLYECDNLLGNVCDHFSF